MSENRLHLEDEIFDVSSKRTEVCIGKALDPGAGPIGTEHLLCRTELFEVDDGIKQGPRRRQKNVSCFCQRSVVIDQDDLGSILELGNMLGVDDIDWWIGGFVSKTAERFKPLDPNR